MSDGRLVPCPFRDDVSITLPDEWLGKHNVRQLEAIDALKEQSLPPVWRDFSVAMALVSDWRIPHMPANRDEWQVENVPIRVMVWVRDVVLDSFSEAFVVPKNS